MLLDLEIYELLKLIRVLKLMPMTDSVLSLIGTFKQVKIILEYVLLNDIAHSTTLKIIITRGIIFTQCVVLFPDSIHALHCIMCTLVYVLCMIACAHQLLKVVSIIAYVYQ